MIAVVRYWREIAIGLLLIALLAVVLVDGRAIARCKLRTADAVAALETTKSDYKVAQAVAASDNLAHVRQVEQANAEHTKETADDLSTQLAAARAAAARESARLRAQADAARRAARAAGVSGQADAASGVAGAGETPDMDADDGDNVVCAEAVVKAEGWQEWWKGLK